MLDFEMPLWIESTTTKLDYNVVERLSAVELDAASEILRAADAVTADGEECYPTVPQKVAVILEGFMQREAVPYDNLSVTEHTGDVALALAGLRLKLDRLKRRRYRQLLKEMGEGRSRMLEMAYFIAAHVEPTGAPIATPAAAPVIVRVMVASQFAPGDADEVDRWLDEVHSGLAHGAETADTPLEITVRHGIDNPEPAAEQPAPPRPAATIVVAHDGNDGDVAFCLGRLSRRHTILWLTRHDAKVPEAIEAARRDSNLQIWRFTDVSEIAALVSVWTRRHAGRLKAAQRELAERRNVNHAAQVELRRRILPMSAEQQVQLVARSGLKGPLIVDVMLDGNAFDDALAETAALATAVGTTLSSIQAPDSPLTLSKDQEKGLDGFADEYPEIPSRKILGLRRRGVEEIKRFDCRWSLTSPEEWRQLYNSYS